LLISHSHLISTGQKRYRLGKYIFEIFYAIVCGIRNIFSTQLFFLPKLVDGHRDTSLFRQNLTAKVAIAAAKFNEEPVAYGTEEYRFQTHGIYTQLHIHSIVSNSLITRWHRSILTRKIQSWNIATLHGAGRTEFLNPNTH
jgi:hypothetical protein